MTDSSAKPIFSTDMKTLYAQMKDLDLANTVGTTSSESMSDILAKMSATKEMARQIKEANRPPAKYVPPGGWKKDAFTPREASRACTLQTLARTKQRNLRTVAAFRPSESKWDGSFTLEPELQKSIYRTPCRDPSGTLFRNLGREPYKGPNVWKPSSVDQDLPDIGVEQLTESFRTRLVVHLSQVVETETHVYENLPVTTDAQRNYKARHGADLNNLRLVKERLLDAIVRIERQDREKTEVAAAAVAAAAKKKTACSGKQNSAAVGTPHS